MFIDFETPVGPYKKSDVPNPISIQSFDQGDFNSFRSDLQQWVDLDIGLIPISIDSYGGRVDGLITIIELVRKLRKEGFTIVTFVNAYAMSCGVLFSGLVGSKGYRYGSPDARYMIHEFSIGRAGKLKEVKARIDETHRFNEYWFKQLGLRCKDDENFFLDLMNYNNNADYYFNSEEALSFNLIDKVGVPMIDIGLKLKAKIR